MCRVAKYEMVAERVASYNSEYIDKTMNNSEEVANFIMKSLESDRYVTERFLVFMLDSKLKVLGFSEVSRGSLTGAPVHPREVFTPAIITPKCGAIIVAHNHPSGDPTPSDDDIAVTERLCKASEIIGIKLLDHIVVGDECYYSLRSAGYIR